VRVGAEGDELHAQRAYHDWRRGDKESKA
jgi:hypothetical protein